MNYYTIDFEDVASTTVSERKSLTGRKKGFYSCPKFGTCGLMKVKSPE